MSQARRLPGRTCAARRSSPCGSLSGPLASTASCGTTKATITASFAGHDHTDDFRVIHAGATGGEFVLIDPPISPIYGQNPAFRVVTFGTEGGLADQSTYYLTNLQAAAERGSGQVDAGVQLCRGMAEPAVGREQLRKNLRPDQNRPEGPCPVVNAYSMSRARTTRCPRTASEASTVRLRPLIPPAIRPVTVRRRSAGLLVSGPLSLREHLNILVEYSKSCSSTSDKLSPPMFPALQESDTCLRPGPAGGGLYAGAAGTGAGSASLAWIPS